MRLSKIQLDAPLHGLRNECEEHAMEIHPRFAEVYAIKFVRESQTETWHPSRTILCLSSTQSTS